MLHVVKACPQLIAKVLVAAAFGASGLLLAQEAATGPATTTTAPANTRPANPLEVAAATGANIYVADSFAAVDKLRDANNKANQGQNEIALNKYQEVINEFGQKLVYVNNDSYVSITDLVRDRLLAMPAVKDGLYDQVFGNDAKKEIELAIQKRDLTNLIRVCDRYFPSTAALNGLSLAAEWYFENAEFASAARTWQLLLKHPMADKGTVRRPLFVFRALVCTAFCCKAIRRRRRCFGARLASAYPNATGPVDGRETDLLTVADGVPPTAVGPHLNCRMNGRRFRGPSHSAVLNVNAAKVDARLWSISLDDPLITGSKNQCGRRRSRPEYGAWHEVRPTQRRTERAQPQFVSCCLQRRDLYPQRRPHHRPLCQRGNLPLGVSDAGDGAREHCDELSIRVSDADAGARIRHRGR